MENTDAVQVPQLKDFEALVAPHLNGAKITSYTSKYLNKPGDNYGSCMISVSAKIEDTTGKETTTDMVAKVPPVSDFFFDLFCPERTFRTENSFYLDVIPAFEAIERKIEIPPNNSFLRIFPKCYGGRVNCHNDVGSVDRDALLVLENLVVSGFKPGTRSKFFDQEHGEFILRNLAKFHAISFVLRKHNPEEFKKIINRHFKKFYLESNCTDSDIRKATNNDEKVIRKFSEFTELSKASNCDGVDCSDGLYTAICHYDFWINNMMIKYDSNSKPIDIKIVDFQISQYNSVARDVFFFLFSSVETATLKNNFKNLLKIYFDSLIESLNVYGCSIDEYSFESFLQEVQKISFLEIPHSMFMLKVVMANVKVENDDFSKIDNLFTDENENIVGDEYYQKMFDNFQLLQEYGYL